MKPILKLVMPLALGATMALHAGPGLIKAAINGDLDAVKEKLAAGENINEPGRNGWTPLMWAVWYRQLPVTKFLLEKGADPNLQTTDSYKSYAKGATALIIASIDCQDDQASALVKRKAKVDLLDANGNSAEAYARKNECPTVLRALGFKVAANRQLDELVASIEAGKNVNEADQHGWTPLMWSVFHGDLPTTELFLGKGADPNFQATGTNKPYVRGTTALILASQLGLTDLAKVLLKKGAKKGIIDSSGNTAESYAYSNSYYEFLDLLVDQTPLGKTYQNLVISQFTSSVANLKNYANVLSECQSGLLETVAGNKGFEKVEIASPGKTYDASTLLVQAEITQLHIPNGAARFFVGPLAGRTNMDVKVKLVDVGTGEVLREQMIRSANNIWVSSFTLGGRDQDFAKETGAIIANYVLALCGKATAAKENASVPSIEAEKVQPS